MMTPSSYTFEIDCHELNVYDDRQELLIMRQAAAGQNRTIIPSRYRCCQSVQDMNGCSSREPTRAASMPL